MAGLTNGSGIAETDHYRSELPPSLPGDPEPRGDDTLVVIQNDADEPTESVEVETPGGATIIYLNGRKAPAKTSVGAQVHNANLAEYIDQAELARISDELLDGIEADKQSRQEWIDRRASGIKHLALKVENPRSPSADADTAVEGQTTVRWPGMLDAVLRHQANAKGELLPAGGPVKVTNYATIKTRKRQMMERVEEPLAQPGEDDILADDLETEFNYYLTEVDKEYYPDTNRMFFLQGFGGCGFKKVYRCPIRRRPVSRSCDAEEIIVSDNEISLHECSRVTHRIMMSQSTMKRMQLASIYREVDLTTPLPADKDAVERAEDDVAGFSSWNSRPADYKHTVYECYCELDVAGFEHKESQRYTGLPLPYRVTIDKDSQEILEVRRNWKENDDRYVKKMPIVKFPFVDGIGFYGIGLLHIMGNATAAVTTAWRLALDSAGFASWPGFLYADTVARQDTMDFRIGMGSGRKINTGGQPIGNAVMGLPYKDATAGLYQIITHIEEEARRVGSTPELAVGEGRQDAPVGTTLANLDQALKVVDSVHKGMHTAQAEEFSLLRDLFREDPTSLVCNNPSPARKWEEADIVKALNNCKFAPQADPNTPSHTFRVMKAVALVQLVSMSPGDYDLKQVARRVSDMVGLGSLEELFSDNPQGKMDPKMMAAMVKLQGDMMKIRAEIQNDEAQRAMDMAIEKLKAYGELMQLASNTQVQQMQMKTALLNAHTEERKAEHAQKALVLQHALGPTPGAGAQSRGFGGRII